MLRWQPVVFFLARWQSVALHNILNVVIVLLLIIVSASPIDCIVIEVVVGVVVGSAEGVVVGGSVDSRSSGVRLNGGVINNIVCVGIRVVKRVVFEAILQVNLICPAMLSFGVHEDIIERVVGWMGFPDASVKM
jgi:hypothetical protein